MSGCSPVSGDRHRRRGGGSAGPSVHRGCPVRAKWPRPSSAPPVRPARSGSRCPEAGVCDACQSPGGQLEHAGGAAARQPHRARAAGSTTQSITTPRSSSASDVDREAHAPGVDAAARHDPAALRPARGRCATAGRPRAAPRVAATPTLDRRSPCRCWRSSAIEVRRVTYVFSTIGQQHGDEPDRRRADGHDPDRREDAEDQREHHLHAGLGRRFLGALAALRSAASRSRRAATARRWCRTCRSGSAS